MLAFGLMTVVQRPEMMAQTSFLAGQYILNPFNTNPAVAGMFRVMPMQLTYRQQWMGMAAAPSIQAFTMHANLQDKGRAYTPGGFLNKGKHSYGRIGLGGGAFNFSYGDISQVGLHLDYAYHVFLGRGRMAFGLGALYHQYNIDKSGFILPDGNIYDPVVHGDPKENLHFFDINAGVHYYSDKVLAGFSVIQLFNSSARFGTMSYVMTDQPGDNSYLARSMYGYFGMILGGGMIEIEPSVMAKYNMVKGIGASANLLLKIAEVAEAGISYSYKESIGILAGASIAGVVIRYLYEIPMGSDQNVVFNTHQISAGFNLQLDR